MNCPTCGTENALGARYCRNCGVPLETHQDVACSTCGTTNPWDALYCSSCGVLLGQPATSVDVAGETVAVEYMGFWIRLAAAIIDGIIISIIFGILFAFIFSETILRDIVNVICGWAYHTLFIGLRGQTPGKMVLRIKVVNEQGVVPGLGYAALREIPGKIISGIVFLLGYIWVAFDSRKQAWHDKMAKTYVVRAR